MGLYGIKSSLMSQRLQFSFSREECVTFRGYEGLFWDVFSSWCLCQWKQKEAIKWSGYFSDTNANVQLLRVEIMKPSSLNQR